jgi:hypothetical protein
MPRLSKLFLLSLLLVMSLGQVQAREIVYYDMTSLFELDLNDPVQLRRFYDETHLVTSLQGLVNRDEARLYIRYNKDSDDFWWNHLTRNDGWLEKHTVREIKTLGELLTYFKNDYHGAVVWDERVPATSNLASSIAGVESLLCLRYDLSMNSLYYELVNGPTGLAIGKMLLNSDGSPLFTGQGTIPGTTVASSGSAKCDAYLWLIEHYVKTGKSSDEKMGYYLDAHWFASWKAGSKQNHTLTNHDYVIAHKGVVFDLHVWPDEAPVDDPNQKPGTDVQTLKTLLHAVYAQNGQKSMIHVAGFTPWAYKYTDFKNANWNAGGRYGGVATEWKYAEILSCFNAYMDADAIGYCAMANASFYQHYPVPKLNPQNAKPTLASMKAKGYIDEDGKIVPKKYYSHYVGDYDSAAWLYWMLPRLWTDQNRGAVPLSWAFNPNLCERFPVGMLWTRKTRTPNDFFVAGDSGAGYVNPALLSEPRPHSNLSSGLTVWEKHCQKFYDQWDISLTGFVIDGNGPGLPEEGLDAYARFSPDGIVPQKIPLQGLHKNMPYLRMAADLPGDPHQAAQMILTGFHGSALGFKVYRSILKSPSWYLSIEKEIDNLEKDTSECVDLYTLLWLTRYYEEYQKTDEDQNTEFSELSALKSSPHQEEGLRIIAWSDGPLNLKSILGLQSWVIHSKTNTNYLYVAMDDGFSRRHKGTLKIKVNYLDQGRGTFSLHYDSTDRNATFGGYYKDAAPVIQRTNSGDWKTAEFIIKDGRFENGQNGGADFRIYSHGDDLHVREISVEAVP